MAAVPLNNDKPADEVKRVNYPPNSHASKVTPEKPERKNVEKIVSGKVTAKKKPLGKRISEMFFGEDKKDVGEYIFRDVLIPSAKDLIEDIVKGGIEMLLFGERRSRSISRDRGKSIVNYSGYFKNDRERDARREISKTSRARHDFNEIVLEDRVEAENVLSRLVDLTIDYGMASVADLYDLVGATSNFTDHKYGWDDLRDANVSRVRGGYLIDLPRTKLLD